MDRTIRSAAVLLGVLVFAAMWTPGSVFAGGGLILGLGPSGPACSAGCGECGCSCWCPDDYCPKPAPCVCLPSTCGSCDDYCPKPAPCVCLPPICGCCDDYCPKPDPCINWSCIWPDFYQCVPTR